MKTKQIVLFAMMLMLAVVLASQLRRTDIHEPPAVVAPGNAFSASPAAASTADSIDNQVCAECHAEIVADYARSGMSHTWRAVAPEAIRELQGQAEVADLASGYNYRISVTDTGIEQTESRPDDPKHQLRRDAQYLVGSGTNAVATVTSEHGYLTQMPAAWFRHEHTWRMNPGFELHNHRFDRPITPGCIACHGTTAIHEPPTTNQFQEPVVAGIGCQRCHGSSPDALQQHVTFHSAAKQRGASPDATNEGQDATLAGAIRVAPERANDLCLQCHLQGDAAVYQSGNGPLQLRPGDRLRDHRHDFLVDTGEPSALGIASHGARMLQSRCYVDSRGGLTCVLCHDPHKPAADFDADDYDYDNKCATCHTPQSCSRTGAGPENALATGCVACHMPQRSSREGIHLVLTDHAIVRHKPSTETIDRAANVLAPNTARVELVSAWPGDNPDRKTLGAAYVLLHETMGPQIPSLQRGADILAEAIDLNPADLESRFWLGSALAGLGRGAPAIPLLTEVLAEQPQRHIARFRLAIAYELVGEYDPAIKHYQQLVDRVPNWIEPYPRSAQLYIAKRQPELAVGLLRQQLTYQQDALALSQLALAGRMRGGSHEAAMARAAEALRLNPRLPAAYVHRAALLLLVGQQDLAKKDFQRVLELDPENAQAKHALKTLAAEAAR